MTRTANEFLTPQAIKVEAASGTSAKVILEPLERGFGHTLGNALRRILLSSLPGAAVVEVEIEGVYPGRSRNMCDSHLPAALGKGIYFSSLYLQ